MMTVGGQRAGAGTYWNMMNGERVDLSQESVLPGGRNDRYIKAPSVLAVAAGPLLGLIFAIFLPFIGIAMAAGIAIRKVMEALSDVAAGSMSFGWRPLEAYLSGRKRRRAVRIVRSDAVSGKQ
jgi:hypothetical protein